MNRLSAFLLILSFQYARSVRRMDSIINAAYDSSIHPGYDYPVMVNVSIGITTMDFDDEKHMVTLNGVLRQEWEDINLRPSHLTSVLVLQGERFQKYKEDMWLPDIDFAEAFRSEKIVNGDFMQIEDKGKITWTQKIRVEFPCEFDFSNYPVDENSCFIKLHSLGYTHEDFHAKWSIDEAIHYDEAILSHRYEICEVKPTESTVVFMYKTRKRLEAELILETRSGWSVKYTILPFIIAVITAYLSFFINIRGTSARILICGIAMIFALYFHNSTYKDAPKVHYVMAVEIFTSSCLTFVWIALAETVIIDTMSTAGSSMNSHNSLTETLQTNDLNEDMTPKGYVLARWVDRCFKIIYPALFLAFNGIFWIVYH